MRLEERFSLKENGLALLLTNLQSRIAGVIIRINEGVLWSVRVGAEPLSRPRAASTAYRSLLKLPAAERSRPDSNAF